jgi:1-acyl-sn-glycerol-3-phosphate acyltransferase
MLFGITSSRLHVNFKLAFRLTRVSFHLLVGVAACALYFPWSGKVRRDRYVQRWSRVLLAICGVSVQQTPGAVALEHAMIVANHVSWLDIFVINAMHPCHFVAKSEIREWPLLGYLAAKGGTVFLARGNRRELRHTFKGMVAALQAGERVAFFPEGTTGAQGAVLPFHANLFEAAVDAGALVQPYALRYVDARGEWHPSIDFTGETTFAQSMIKVLSGARIQARLTCLEPLPAAHAHRRDLARAAHDAVDAALAA